jgi:PAS domain S-box-containing protein
MKNQQAQIPILPDNSSGLREKFRFWTGDWGGKAVIFFGILTLLHMLYINYHWGGDEYLKAVNDSVMLLLYAGVFLMLLRTSRNEALSPRTKRAWQLFAIAYLSSTIASVLWVYFELITETAPFPSWADPFYLAFYPLMLAGLLFVAPKIETNEDRAKLVLDGGIVTLGGGMLLWYFILHPIAHAGTDDQLLTALSLAYPICDLVMLFGVSVVLFRRSAAGVQWSLNFLLAGLTVNFIANTIFGYQSITGTYQNGSLSDILYLIVCFLMILAAHAQYKSASGEVPIATRVQKKQKSFSWLPYLAIAAGYGLLLSFVYDHLDSILSQLILIAVALTLMVVLRQIISIRENVKAKEALWELQERFQGIYDSSKDAIAFASFDGTLIDVNDAFASLVGYSEEELITGKTYQQLTPAEYHQSEAEHIRKAIEFDLPGEYEKEYLRKDGTRVPISVTSFAVKGNNGKPMGLAAIVRNITERKLAESEVREAQDFLRNVIDTVPNLIFVKNSEGRFTLVNRAFAETNGRTVEDIIGKTGTDLLKIASEAELIYLDDQQVFESGQEKTILEHKVTDAKGELHWFHTVKRPLISAEKNKRYLLGVATDLTDRKLLEEQMQRGQKLESIGQLAAGIAHEINTPTQYVGDNTRFLKDSFNDLAEVLKKNEELLKVCHDQGFTHQIVTEMEAAIEFADTEYLLEEIPKSIEQSLNGIGRIGKIVQSMKDFAHPGSVDKRAVDLNRAIESTITVASNEWRYVAEMETDFDQTLPNVPCLIGEFNQVILNMIVNAAHAISDVVGDGSNGKGTIRISTKHEGDWVEISVSDTGIGMPEEIRKKIFDPFFTTKEIGKGTGQGLAISHTVIVEKHKGTIDVESEVGQGTTFIISLPISHDSQ